MALDASVLIAHLNPADPHHRAVTEILLAGTPGEMLVHMNTMAEVATFDHALATEAAKRGIPAATTV